VLAPAASSCPPTSSVSSSAIATARRVTGGSARPDEIGASEISTAFDSSLSTMRRALADYAALAIQRAVAAGRRDLGLPGACASACDIGQA
jgi:hypothetical protein